MKYALYPGCIMQTEQYAYEMSIREVFSKLGVELVDIKGFSCCGEPLKSVNQMLTLSLSARNIAIAEKEKLNIFAPCPICHLALSECKHILNSNSEMKDRVNKFIEYENITYIGEIEIVHTIDLLHDIIGLEKIKELVKSPIKELKIACHYGCHTIRPSELGRPDNSENPRKMEKIIEAIGGKTENYPEKLDCCGGLLNANLPESALTKTGQKLKSLQDRSFDVLVDVCPWCHRQYDSKQVKAGEIVAAKLNIPILYLTQIIGLSFDVPKEKLGLQLNQSNIDKLII